MFSKKPSQETNIKKETETHKKHEKYRRKDMTREEEKKPNTHETKVSKGEAAENGMKALLGAQW